VGIDAQSFSNSFEGRALEAVKKYVSEGVLYFCVLMHF